MFFRCKLYYKKGDTWADRGVGNLYLKKSDNETVLLVRADTALGIQVFQYYMNDRFLDLLSKLILRF